MSRNESHCRNSGVIETGYYDYCPVRIVQYITVRRDVGKTCFHYNRGPRLLCACMILFALLFARIDQRRVGNVDCNEPFDIGDAKLQVPKGEQVVYECKM